MPTLKSYLGSLASGINAARTQTDLESVFVAEQYAQHDLLKYFSIPRLRLKEVELTIPVAIDTVDYADTDFKPIDKPDFNAKALQQLRSIHQVTSFSAQVEQNVTSILTITTDQLEQEIIAGQEILVALDNFSNRTAQETRNVIKGDQSVPQPLPAASEVTTALRQNIGPEIKEQADPNSIENLNVIVEAGQLRDFAPENLVYIKMTVLEEGMEWQTVENADGELYSKLVPE